MGGEGTSAGRIMETHVHHTGILNGVSAGVTGDHRRSGTARVNTGALEGLSTGELGKKIPPRGRGTISELRVAGGIANARIAILDTRIGDF